MKIIANTTLTIWNQYHRSLYSFILSRVKNKMQADDVLQEVFLKVHLKLETLQDHNKLQSWLFQVCRNTIQDQFRRDRMVSDLPIPEKSEVPEENGLNKFINCLPAFIKRLPLHQKTALVSTHFNGESQIDFARKEGTSYTTVKSRVQAAKEKLHQLLTNCCNQKESACDSEQSCACAA